jgi:hypothetical protein
LFPFPLLMAGSLSRGKDQHAALVGDGRQQMVGGTFQQDGQQWPGAFGQRKNGLAFGITRHQIFESG